MDLPIADRKHLYDLKKWIEELHQKHSYRWIAAKTWRGANSQGYWERVAKGAHLEKKPSIRPRFQDWYDIRLLRITVADYDSADTALFDAAMSVVEARAELDRAVAKILSLSRSRAGEK